MYEKIGRPVERREEVIRREEMQVAILFKRVWWEGLKDLRRLRIFNGRLRDCQMRSKLGKIRHLRAMPFKSALTALRHTLVHILVSLV